ncbi:MAG: WecB/TagA/CpsF family glycosyltransferase [Clostridia bacterium]|nr:WecB/TagA/CpsF family glycosyltransferase [Clostridia bacterium]
MENRVSICGVGFDRVTAKEAKNRLFRALSGKKPPLSLYTPNPEIVELACRDPELSRILNEAGLSVADGVGVIRAARMLGDPLPERIPGVELGEAMLAFCAEDGEALPVFFLGGKPGIAEKAAERMREKYPGLSVAGTADGYFDEAKSPEVAGRVASSGAVLLFVCLGAPKQEKWIAAHRAKMPGVRVFAALGGSLDVYAGALRRAPRIFCRFGLEWLWRVIRQPSRIRRLFAVPAFLRRVRREKRRQKRGD